MAEENVASTANRMKILMRKELASHVNSLALLWSSVHCWWKC